MPGTATIYRVTSTEWIIDVVETNVAAGDYVEIFPEKEHRFPMAGEIVRIDSRLTGGDATTIHPQLSSATTFAVPYLMIEAGSGPVISEVRSSGVPYGIVGSKIYHRSNPDAGVNNSVLTRYLIRRRWEE